MNKYEQYLTDKHSIRDNSTFTPRKVRLESSGWTGWEVRPGYFHGCFHEGETLEDVLSINGQGGLARWCGELSEFHLYQLEYLT